MVAVGPDAVVGAVVRLLTPPLCELYAVLMRAGVVVGDNRPARRVRPNPKGALGEPPGVGGGPIELAGHGVSVPRRSRESDADRHRPPRAEGVVQVPVHRTVDLDRLDPCGQRRE